jgi:DNA invertase Pin-like site-specific DNA recombinase
MAKLGYARVSTHQQSLDIQIERLLKEGVREDRIFTDKASGKDTDKREGLQRLMVRAEDGDAVFVTKMDRLGRNTLDMVSLVEQFTAQNVVVHFIDDHLSTAGETGKLIITILAAVAEAERARILERTNEGRQAAMERGVKFGRPQVADTEKLKALLAEGVAKTEIAKQLGVTRQYVYKLMKNLEQGGE